MGFRKLSESEITSLTQQGCRAESWDKVQVADGFNTERVYNVSFAGEVSLGVFDSDVSFPCGMKKPCGVYNSSIYNSAIGDNAYISEVKNLANYDINKNAVIENVASMIVKGETAFGNGTELEILNEGGGRDLKIYDKLTSQIAYMMVMYRHDSSLIDNLNKMIDEYVDSVKSTRGLVDENARVLNTGEIINVKVGRSATIAGSLLLEEGTIVSCPEAPSFVGEGVSAENFIIHSGSKVANSAILSNCFVGQGVKMGKQYSAENSTFFANCEGFHGEACSLFAGPYTVTHHKSTLLIAVMLSFYNAGSGSNQSNHMYKLGPVHQGIMERGSKTGSFSYLLWPNHIGPFTAVIGKHYSNIDTPNMPFSYIFEKEGKTMLRPALNMFTVGTRRDSRKWPARDRREDPDKLDLIHFNLLNPFIIQKMMAGIEILKDLDAKAGDEALVPYNGTFIKRKAIKDSIENYEAGVNMFIGDCLLAQLEQSMAEGSFENAKMSLKPQCAAEAKWVDLFGLLAPASSVQSLLAAVASGEVKDMAELNNRLKQLFESYGDAEWAMCAQIIESKLDIQITEITTKQVSGLISAWKESYVKLNNKILNDAQKEFDTDSMIGCGIDGDQAVKVADFEAVRGKYEDDKFVKEVMAESDSIKQRAEKMLDALSQQAVGV
ncbi:DUF4954 family protein [Fibrobacterota bacterium]